MNYLQIERMQKNAYLITAFILYLIILIITISNHELWGDEIHSWNIAKESSSFLDLLSNIRYEGHPPLWYILLWITSKITHNVNYIQYLHFLIVVPVAFIILFHSPFHSLSKVMILFGYYFIFEYGVLSRNYALGVLLVFCICLVLNKDFKLKYLCYYFLLFLLSNVHLLACVMAASVHLYFLLQKYLSSEKRRNLILNGFLGLLVILPTLVFIFPPSDSHLNMDFWFGLWNFKKFLTIFQAIYKAFLPISAWWKYNFWNSFFLIDLQENYRWIRIITYLLAILFLLIIFYLLKNNKRGLIIFFTNLTFTFLVSLIFPLTSARYVGYLFISFLVASWMSYRFNNFNKEKLLILNILLSLQILPGIFAVYMDLKFPFSNSSKVKELISILPGQSNIITDYWGLNNLSAYIDKPFYTLEWNKKISFIKWEARYKFSSYLQPVKLYMDKRHLNSIYFISSNSPERIKQLDSVFYHSFNIKLLSFYDKAIEKSSDVYLYQVDNLPNSQP